MSENPTPATPSHLHPPPRSTAMAMSMPLSTSYPLHYSQMHPHHDPQNSPPSLPSTPGQSPSPTGSAPTTFRQFHQDRSAPAHTNVLPHAAEGTHFPVQHSLYPIPPLSSAQDVMMRRQQYQHQNQNQGHSWPFDARFSPPTHPSSGTVPVPLASYPGLGQGSGSLEYQPHQRQRQHPHQQQQQHTPHPQPTTAPPNPTPTPSPHRGSFPPWTLAGSLDPSTGIFYRTPENPRLRTAQACEKCRTRKAKCSGEHPTCNRCLTRGLICEYAKEGRMRGPNRPKNKDQGTDDAAVTANLNSPTTASGKAGNVKAHRHNDTGAIKARSDPSDIVHGSGGGGDGDGDGDNNNNSGNKNAKRLLPLFVTAPRPTAISGRNVAGRTHAGSGGGGGGASGLGASNNSSSSSEGPGARRPAPLSLETTSVMRVATGGGGGGGGSGRRAGQIGIPGITATMKFHGEGMAVDNLNHNHNHTHNNDMTSSSSGGFQVGAAPGGGRYALVQNGVGGESPGYHLGVLRGIMPAGAGAGAGGLVSGSDDESNSNSNAFMDEVRSRRFLYSPTSAGMLGQPVNGHSVELMAPLMYGRPGSLSNPFSTGFDGRTGPGSSSSHGSAGSTSSPTNATHSPVSPVSRTGFQREDDSDDGMLYQAENVGYMPHGVVCGGGGGGVGDNSEKMWAVHLDGQNPGRFGDQDVGMMPVGWGNIVGGGYGSSGGGGGGNVSQVEGHQDSELLLPSHSGEAGEMEIEMGYPVELRM